MANPTPPQPSPAPTDLSLGAVPADAANPNAPAGSSVALPSAGSFVKDPNTGLTTTTVIVNGKVIELTINNDIDALTPVGSVKGPEKGGGATVGTFGGLLTQNFQDALDSIQNWYGNSTIRQKYIDEMYSAGLISSKKAPSAESVAMAWQLVVQEAALQRNDPSADQGMTSPDTILAKAAQQGWNNIGAKQAVGDVTNYGTGNTNNSQDTSSQSETVYKSYVDPATAAGTLADSYFRLMGRNPTQSEYQAFFNSLYAYQSEENTGKFETTEKGPNTGSIDPTTGQPVDQSGTDTGGTSTVTNTVSQRGIAQRGVQFLAGQQALTDPEEGAYQAATTYFNAFIKALAGPASGMEASGPTTTVP